MRSVVNGQAARRTDMSWIVWMVRSMLAVGVVSDGALFVDDFSWDVRARFVHGNRS